MTTSTEESAAGNGALYRLLAWLSPSFPIGAFSYSHGLEAATESGVVQDRATLQNWVAAIVVHGSGRMDADILRDAHRAVTDDDAEALDATNRRGVAYRATAELALESAQQGEAFQRTHEAAWRDAGICPLPDPPPQAGEGSALGARVGARGKGVCHAAVFGAVAARASIALEDALLGYLQAFAANLVSAGLRLGIVGQTDGQRILAALEPDIIAAAHSAVAREPADFGSATFAVDLASMAHETQYTRLFRS